MPYWAVRAAPGADVSHSGRDRAATGGVFFGELLQPFVRASNLTRWRRSRRPRRAYIWEGSVQRLRARGCHAP
jgi:hypothetical protein